MVEHERFESFLESLPECLPKHLVDLELENIKEGIPIIRKGGERLIRFMLGLKKPVNILEVGTATGFSALLMLEYIGKEAKITTIERMEERAVKAEENFKKYDKRGQITLIKGMLLMYYPNLWQMAMSTTLYLWMPQKDSISTFLRILKSSFLREEYSLQIICFKREGFLIQDILWLGGREQFTKE